MKSYFPDVNVWIALASNAHQQHSAAVAWFEDLNDDLVYFCRFTQIAFLRLLTHPSVMKGDVQTQRGAWQTYDLVVQHERISFMDEADRSQTELAFRRFTGAVRPSSKQWPDAYLAAFAETAGLTLVTFDRALQQSARDSLLLI